MEIALTLFLLSVTLGGWLLVRGLLGRQVDDHPLCRKCGFDLSGLPGNSTKCSECGADLNAPRAIRVGHRERGQRALGAGGILTGLAILVGASLVVSRFTSFEWQSHKPLWLLKQELTSADASTQKKAILEVMHRMGRRELSDEQTIAVAAIGLSYQADLNKPWRGGFGEIIEAARRQQLITDMQWDQYLHDAFQPKLHLREKVRRGDPLPITIEMECRGGREAEKNWRSYEDDSVTISSIALPGQQSTPGRGHVTGMGSGLWWSRSIDFSPILDRLDDGQHTLALRVNFRNDQERVEKVFTGPFTLLPSSEPSVRFNSDDKFKTIIEQGLQVKEIRITKEPAEHVGADVHVSCPPVGLAFDCAIRVGKREWPAGQAMALAGGGTIWSVGCTASDFPLDSTEADLIFRPSPSSALQTVKLMEIWSGEVVKKGLPIRRFESRASDLPLRSRISTH